MSPQTETRASGDENQRPRSIVARSVAIKLKYFFFPPNLPIDDFKGSTRRPSMLKGQGGGVTIFHLFLGALAAPD